VHFYADPHAIRPYEAQSAMYRALLSVVHQNVLPMPTTLIELAQPLDLSLKLGEPQVREDLGHTDLFANVLNEEQAAFLASRCKQKDFAAGAVVMHHGEEASTMYIILQGALRVTIEAHGAAEEVAVLAAGDVVGEMSLMTSGNRNATVTALTAVRTLEISRETIGELLRNSPELYRNFSEALARRQAQLNALANRPQQKVPDVQHFMDRMMKIFDL
jgi:CRP-like cAMP-binding protein